MRTSGTTRRHRNGHAGNGAAPIAVAQADPGQAAPPASTRKKAPRISPELLAWAKRVNARRVGDRIDPPPRGTNSRNAFDIRSHAFPPSVIAALKELQTPELAQDDMLADTAEWAGQAAGQFAEGTAFLGYAFLATLAQRPEFRVASEEIAGEMTREWIEVKSKGNGKDKAEKVKQIQDDVDTFKLHEVFRDSAEGDGLFGRGHIYIDTGDTDDREELKQSIGNGADDVSKTKLSKGKLKGFRSIEASWAYPTSYNSNDPLKADWYNPQAWVVMSKQVHHTRLLTMVGRKVPDMLKPAYAFGGLSMSQMMMPYVDNWLRTRQSIADLLEAFSIMVLATSMDADMGEDNANLFSRVDFFNATRNNRGMIVVDKETETVENVSAPLGTLDALQAQSQEHMASVSRIPIVKLLGIQPAGLNASSEGEIRSFYDWIHSFQEKLFREPLTTCINFIQLNRYGEVDPDITFIFKDLWQIDEAADASVQQTKAGTHQSYLDMNVVQPEDIRKSLVSDPDSPYAGIDLAELPPPPEPDLSSLGAPGGGMGGAPGAMGPHHPGQAASPHGGAGAPNGTEPRAPASFAQPHHEAGSGRAGTSGGVNVRHVGPGGGRDATFREAHDGDPALAGTDAWEEGKHPRGHTGNPGQFASGGGSAASPKAHDIPDEVKQHPQLAPFFARDDLDPVVRSVGGRQQIEFHPKPHPSAQAFPSGRPDQPDKVGYYDPRFAELQTLNGEEPIIARKIAVPKAGVDTEFKPPPDPDAIYRGVSAEEYAEIARTGEVRSKGDWNIGSAQQGLTYWTKDPRMADSYANGFAPAAMKPTFARPAYIVATRMPAETRSVAGTSPDEVGVARPIRRGEITGIWRGDPIAYEPGNYDFPRAGNPGISGTAPRADLRWTQIHQAQDGRITQDAWQSEQHPRGQPHNKGQFAAHPSAGGGAPPSTPIPEPARHEPRSTTPTTSAPANVTPVHGITDEDRDTVKAITDNAGAWLTTPKAQDVAGRVATAMGFDKTRIKVSNEKPPYFMIGDQMYQGGGESNRNTGQITLWPDASSPNEFPAVTAHEVMHQKWSVVQRAWEAGQPGFKEALDPLLLGEGMTALATHDGVTRYSKMYWDNKQNQGTALDETLAEIARLDWTGTMHKFPVVEEPWKKLYDTINQLYPKAQPSEGQAMAGAPTSMAGAAIQDAHSAERMLQAAYPRPMSVEAFLAHEPPEVTAKIHDMERKLAQSVPTDAPVAQGGHKLPNGKWTPEREKLHLAIVRQILTPEAVLKAKPAPGEQSTYTLLGGRGGSGKSWFTRDGGVIPSNNLVLDNDAIKSMLPEYQGWNAALLHEEASDIFDRVDRMARELGINVVHDATMKTYSSAKRRIDDYRKAGYRVHGHYLFASPEVAAHRAVQRFMGEGGRYVPPSYILGSTSNEKSFDALRPDLDRWSLYRASTGPDRAPPELVAHEERR